MPVSPRQAGIVSKQSTLPRDGAIPPAIAASYQEDLRRQIKVFTQIVSSGVLMFAFGFVAFIAYAIVSAVFQVSASFKF